MAGFNGSAKTSKQDYMNLLYSDSDSDQVPDLKLPPVKGKKKRMRKVPNVSLSGKGEGAGTACCGCLKAIFALVIFSVLVVLTALLIWTLQQVSDLQRQVHTLQKGTKAETDVAAVEAQLKGVEKSFSDLSKEGGVIQTMKDSAMDLNIRLKKVEAATDKLNKSVNSAQDLMNAPSEIKTLENLVARMGSDFEEQKAKTAQVDGIEQRLSALEKQLEESQSKAAEVKPAIDAQYQGMLLQQLASVNESSVTAITTVQDNLEILKGRMSTLEKFSQSQAHGMERDEVETLVLALLQEKFNNMTINESKSPRLEQLNMSLILEGLNSLSKTVAELKGQSQSMVPNTDSVGKEDFELFKEITAMNFEKANHTIYVIDEEFATLSASIKTMKEAISGLSTRFNQLQEKQQQNATRVTADKRTEQVRDNTTGPIHVGDVTVSPTTKPGVESTQSMSSPAVSETSEPERRVLHIDGINTVDDLDQEFAQNLSLNNGVVGSEILSTLIDEKMTEEELLNLYDADKDGQFSEDELREALGLGRER